MSGEIRYMKDLKELNVFETEPSEKFFWKRESGKPEIFSSKELTSQEIAETVHKNTKKAMISEFGQYMSKQQIEYLRSRKTKERLHVVTSAEYVEKFPTHDFSVAGHCDEKGNIYIKDISSETVKHISAHETMHLCANREIAKEEDGICKTVRGLRETLDFKDGTYLDLSRGINEGATESYTLRKLYEWGEVKAAASIEAYSEARMWFERMEELIGSEKMAEAYFGSGKNRLVEEFKRLNNDDEDAWEKFSKDIDILTSGSDTALQEQARERLIDQYTTMLLNQ